MEDVSQAGLTEASIAAPEVKTVTQELPKPLNEAEMRQMVMAVEKQAEQDVAGTPAQTSPEPELQPQAQAPAKFLNPDGTVDVEKLKASTRQLEEGIKQKQELKEKTVDDYVREYTALEKEFRSMPSNPDVIRRQLDQNPPPAQVQAAPMAPQQPQDLSAIRAQIQQDLQTDPVGTIIDLVKAVSQKELEPIAQERQKRAEAERDEAMRRNIAEIATSDRRILDPGVFQAVNQELQSDPGYRNLRNPHLAAFSVVKERLRLGMPQQPAQPGRPPSPILGGGTPPPVPSASGSVTPQALMGAISQAKTPQERSALEQQIRALMSSLG